ncbi:MAG TPA: nuclear transport factor 2 family protein [Opitutaceae bacterium]
MALLPFLAPAQQSSPSPDSLFAVRFTTGPNWDPAKSPNGQAHFADHSANLSRMRREGLLVIGARYGEVGLVVLRLPDEDAVKAQIARDPSIEAGTFVAKIDRFMPFMHGSTQAPLATSEAVALRAYYDAFNLHDADATAAFLAEDVKWFSVSGDTQSLDGDGRESIRDWLAGYFKQLPDVKAEVLELRQTGAHLFVHERVSWTTADGSAKRAAAIAIYEVRDELVRRVWYFPPGE